MSAFQICIFVGITWPTFPFMLIRNVFFPYICNYIWNMRSYICLPVHQECLLSKGQGIYVSIWNSRSYLTLIRLLRECLLSRGQNMYVSIWNSRSYLTLIRFSWDVSSTEDKGSMVVYGITDLTWPWRTSPGMSPFQRTRDLCSYVE